MNLYLMKLNPAKYAFLMNGGNLLEFLVSNKGIKPNLKKI